MKVTLTPKLEKLIRAKVASGMYDSPSEVVREALRQMNDQDEAREGRLKTLQQEVKRGIRQLRRGEYTEYSQSTIRSLENRIRDIARNRRRLSRKAV